MKQKTLEILLQQVPPPSNPNPSLEQYLTPATIAADILFTAYQWGDIQDKIVVDLGCGTGIFAVGASLTGAKKVIGFDSDKQMITTAKQYAQSKNLMISYRRKDINEVTLKCDTIIMNPPFGAQKSNLKADQKFLKKAFKLARVIYSLHLTKTLPYIKRLIVTSGGKITYEKNYVFPLKWTYSFHEKAVVPYNVTLLRIETL